MGVYRGAPTVITMPTMSDDRIPYSENRPCATCGKMVAHRTANGAVARHNSAKGVVCPSVIGPDEKPTPVPARDARGNRLPMPSTIEKWVLKRDRHRCVRCGNAGNGLEVHHVKEVWEGGEHDPDNLDTLCSDCHRRVTNGLAEDITYEEWKQTPSGYVFESMVVRSRRDTPDGLRFRAQLSKISAADWIDMIQRGQDEWKRRP